jgi:hypothetical protein
MRWAAPTSFLAVSKQGCLLPKLAADSITVLKVLHQARIEAIEKLAGFRRVVAKAGQVRNPLLLLGHVSLSLGNVPFGFRQMAKLHRTVMGQRMIRHRRLLSLAGGSTTRLLAIGAYTEAFAGDERHRVTRGLDQERISAAPHLAVSRDVSCMQIVLDGSAVLRKVVRIAAALDDRGKCG